MIKPHPHILLAGGTGFFGRALLRAWLEAQHAGKDCPRVTVLSRAASSFLPRHPEFAQSPWLTMHAGDICHPASLPQGVAFSHIVHAAADSTRGSQLSPLQQYDQIVTGTRNLLDLAVKCEARRFLFASSGAVYGRQPSHLDRIPEDWQGAPDALIPSNAYGIAKRTAEHLCALYVEAHGLNAVIARCFAFVGPDLPLDVHFAIGNFIRDALWRDEIVVAGDGTPLRSYLDQRDLAHWLLTLLERGASGRAYNVGSDQPISIADLAHLVRDTLAPGKRVRILGERPTGSERDRYIPDIRRAQAELGLAIGIPLRTSIRTTADAHLARPKAPD